MRSKALPGWARTLLTAAAALIFLLAYELVVYKVPVTQIFLPVSSWSDEVIYSKQLAAAVQYGAPQGYFGFNESHADIGTYAAWGPAVFLVYALPGLVLRGQNAFLWCNLLFITLGWTFFARAARLDWKRQLLFGVRDPGHQPAKKEASLKTFDKVEQRVGQTIAVEFSQRVEGIHIAKIEQP